MEFNRSKLSATGIWSIERFNSPEAVIARLWLPDFVVNSVCVFRRQIILPFHGSGLVIAKAQIEALNDGNLEKPMIIFQVNIEKIITWVHSNRKSMLFQIFSD